MADSADQCPHQRTLSADQDANLLCDAYPMELDLGEHGGKTENILGHVVFVVNSTILSIIRLKQ